MEERIIVVDTIGMKSGAKGEYLAVKAKDGKYYNIFDNTLYDVFVPDLAVLLKGETSGKFFNTSSAEQVKDKLVQEAAKEATSVSVTPKYEADPKQNSIENQVCLKLAVECYIADKIKPKDIATMYHELKGIINS